MNMNKIIFSSLIIVLLQGCSPSAETSYKAGYYDGYAEGYNTVCKFDISPAQADWSNKDYIKGYSAGQLDGASKANYAVSAKSCKERGFLKR